MYCVYLTIYGGNKLPPFYIGYSTIDKVYKGYNGTVKSKKYIDIWKEERRINPRLFTTRILSKHPNKFLASIEESKILTFFDAKNNPLYINMHNGCPSGKKHFAHTNESKEKLRKAFSGRKHTEETVEKLRLLHKGKPKSIEHKKKISDHMKTHSYWLGKKLTEEHKEKISQKNRGEGNPFYDKKHSEETKARMSKTRTGSKCPKRRNTYQITKPDGTIEITTNITEYCLSRNLDRSHICKTSSKGFKAKKLSALGFSIPSA